MKINQIGNVGVLLPFSSREDIEFFSNLEGHLRQDHKSLAGRDHLSFRSYYQPVKVTFPSYSPFSFFMEHINVNISVICYPHLMHLGSYRW